jgi:hypothetical protein
MVKSAFCDVGSEFLIKVCGGPAFEKHEKLGQPPSSWRAARATPDEGVRGYIAHVGAEAFLRPAERSDAWKHVSRVPPSVTLVGLLCCCQQRSNIYNATGSEPSSTQ